NKITVDMRKEKNQIVFISSYPPRECGIATFTQDLVNAMVRMFGDSLEIKVIALNEKGQAERPYPDEVIAEINAGAEDNYLEVASLINNNPLITSVIIEHEFGLFGSNYGEDIFYLLNNVSKPVYICFHTVL